MFLKRQPETQFDDYRPDGSGTDGSVVIVERTATRDELKEALETFLQNSAKHETVHAR